MNEIEKLIEFYDQRRANKEHVTNYRNVNTLQKKFTKDFTIPRIRSLKLDEYVLGKQSKKSFCYRIERELRLLGGMLGSSALLFVVYFGAKGKDTERKYRFTKKLGVASDEDEALYKVKQEIIALLQAGQSKDVQSINENRLADLFKYKLLGTYFPEQFLNIYSEFHLDYFIGELGLFPKGSTIIDKQNTLLEFKNSNEVSSKWSNFEFNGFLYSSFEYPDKKENISNTKLGLPPLEEVEAEEVYQTIKKSPMPSPTTPITVSYKSDYAAQQERNNRLGKRGENIIIKHETSFFNNYGFDLTKLEHSSIKDDRLGYDIKSKDEKGKVKYIEVKATRANKSNARFFITQNEMQKAKKLPNYYIYIVFEAHTIAPKIWKIKEPFKGLHLNFSIESVLHRVNIHVDN